MDIQASLFTPTIEQIVEDMIGEIPKKIKIGDQTENLNYYFVLSKKFICYLQVSLDYSLESKILLQLERKNISQRTIDKVFK